MSNKSQTLDDYARLANRPDLYLVDFNHPQGSQYFHNGLGVFEHDDNSYYGVGSLGQITLAANDGALEPQDVTIVLSGLDEETLDKIDYSVKGGTLEIKRVFLRPEDWTVDHVEDIETADLDTMRLSVSEGIQSIVITAIGGIRELRSRSGAFWEPEEQNSFLSSLGLDPSSDTGFDQIHLMRNKIITSQAE